MQRLATRISAPVAWLLGAIVLGLVALALVSGLRQPRDDRSDTVGLLVLALVVAVLATAALAQTYWPLVELDGTGVRSRGWSSTRVVTWDQVLEVATEDVVQVRAGPATYATLRLRDGETVVLRAIVRKGIIGRRRFDRCLAVLEDARHRARFDL